MFRSKSCGVEATRHSVVGKSKGDKALIFDPGEFSSCHGKVSAIVEQNRDVFIKAPAYRTEKELDGLMGTLKELKFFSAYSNATRRQMAHMLYYQNIPPGRIIIKQGDPAMSFYIIITGAIRVDIKSEDDDGHMRQVGELSAGMHFGDRALLHNVKRTCTMSTTEPTELLVLDKDDFEDVLKSTFLAEYNERVMVIENQPLLKAAKFTPEDRTVLLTTSYIKYYEKDKVVYPNVNLHDAVCFIVSGKCRIVRRLRRVRECTADGRVIYQPVFFSEREMEVRPELRGPEQRNPVRRKCNNRRNCRSRGPPSTTSVESVYIQLGTMEEHAYFSVGEQLEDTFLVTINPVKTLSVPMHLLVKGLGYTKLDDMRWELENAIPDNQAVKRYYTKALRWKEYKRNILMDAVADVLNRKKF